MSRRTTKRRRTFAPSIAAPREAPNELSSAHRKQPGILFAGLQGKEVCSERGTAMAEFFKRLKIKVVLTGIAVCILAVLYSYFAADTITTRITDAQMMKVDGKFMIATEDRPLVNYDAKYRFKFNSGTVQNDAIKLRGKSVKIKKYGWRITLLSRYENVVKIEEVK
jgi:hypothetical protein